MNSYRVLVKDKDGRIYSHGTGSFLRSGLVVTAYHVVGNENQPSWCHLVPGQEESTYWLDGLPNNEEVQIKPACYNSAGDVALLTCELEVAVRTYSIATTVAEGKVWDVDAFPEIDRGHISALSGTVTRVRENRLELYIKQGVFVSWAGVSGAPVLIDKKIAGILITEKPKRNTLTAASFEVVNRLIEDYDAIEQEGEILNKMGVTWNGDLKSLHEQLSSKISITELLEFIRKNIKPRKEDFKPIEIRVVAGIDTRRSREEAKKIDLGMAVYGLEFDSDDDSLYVGDAQGKGIHKISKTGEHEILAKNTIYGSGQMDFDVSGDKLYVANRALNMIHMIDVSTNEIKEIAGRGEDGSSEDGTLALEARFNSPFGVAHAHIDSLYIADTYNHCIYRLSLWEEAPCLKRIAGNGTSGYSGDHGPAKSAQLNRPTFLRWKPNFGMPYLNANYLYLSDSGNYCIRRIRLNDGEITTIIGTGKPGFSEDGTKGEDAAIEEPLGIELTAIGLIFVEGHRIRVLANSGVIRTLAGGGTLGIRGDCEDARMATLIAPRTVLSTKNGYYIADNTQIKLLSW